jgi:hypothetical protein
MPHWGLQMDVPDRLRAAIARALDGDFHPGDADQLLALGRALGLLARLGFDDPDFLGRVQSSRDALALRVGDVLREAASEARDDEAVDPEVLLTLTEALAAAFDPHDAGR